MQKRLQSRAGRLLCGALVATLACAVTAWAQSNPEQGGAAQAQPSKPPVAPSPADREPPGGSQRSAQQVGSKVPVESIEPGVNTSAIQPSPPESPSASTTEQPVTPRAPKSAGAEKKSSTGTAAIPAGSSAATNSTPGVSGSSATADGVSPGTDARASASAAARTGSPKSGAPADKAHDRIELDTTQITGNRELPKVLYIVPWKRSDLGDLVGKPVNSLLDEVLTPVDRDVFKRQNRYYDALKPDAAKDPAGAVAGPEKP
jgi:hypothetical protein